jgi:hypothetical protein
MPVIPTSFIAIGSHSCDIIITPPSLEKPANIFKKPDKTPITTSTSPLKSPPLTTLLPAQPPLPLPTSSTTVTTVTSPAPNLLATPQKRRHSLPNYSRAPCSSPQHPAIPPFRRYFNATSSSTMVVPFVTTPQTTNRATISVQTATTASETMYQVADDVRRPSNTETTEVRELRDDEQTCTLGRAVYSTEQPNALQNPIQRSRSHPAPPSSPQPVPTSRTPAAAPSTLPTCKDMPLPPSDTTPYHLAPPSITTAPGPLSTMPVFTQKQPKTPVFNQNRPKLLVLDENETDFHCSTTNGPPSGLTTLYDEETTRLKPRKPPKPLENTSISIIWHPKMVATDVPTSGKDPPSPQSPHYDTFHSLPNIPLKNSALMFLVCHSLPFTISLSHTITYEIYLHLSLVHFVSIFLFICFRVARTPPY